MENKNLNEVLEKDVTEQFSEFLKTKGLTAKFKLAFENMKESAKIQHANDVEAFNELKRQSAEDNKDFVEFLHTKGLKAKVRLVIENIKKGAKESKEKTKYSLISQIFKNRTIKKETSYKLHVVKTQSNYEEIASLYNIDVECLKNANNDEEIYIGKLIFIPNE